jgi:hypothetical protein
MREYGPFTFRPPGVNEYRIVAPIKRRDTDLWGVWAYTCREAEYDAWIYKFAYAEAAREELLPDFPFPAQPYIDSTWQMVDGNPITAK